MHRMGLTPSEWNIIIEISINNIYLDMYCLPFQSNGKVGQDTEWSQIVPVESFQIVRGLV